jgi:phage terminase large subunit GpA-like protein
MSLVNRKNNNISERKFLGRLLLLFKKPLRISTWNWSKTYRVLTKEESVHVGNFDPDKIPALEYVYDCLDNWFIYIVVAMKGSQVGWSELTNNWLGKLIHTSPCKIQWVFPGLQPARIYSREKLKIFFNGTTVLRDIINQGSVKENFSYFKFPGGFLKLVTAGAIYNLKTSSIPVTGVEEPDDVKEDVKGQGSTFDLLKGRAKTFPVGEKKLLFGGTPTDEDFSTVSSAYKESNQLVFKAHCHHCGELSELTTNNLYYNEYPNYYNDEKYGKYDPESAYYLCPHCNGEWSFEDKDRNIREGKKYGFTDHTGKFSKGWHPKKPEITETFGFHIPELLSTLSTSTFQELARKKILATLALERNDEGLMKSFVNNTDGLPYNSGIASITEEDMILLRSSYDEHIVPIGGLLLTAGIDVQLDRFAVIIRAWGRNGNSWLVSWFEIFGEVTNQEAPVWQELVDRVVNAKIPTESGKFLRIASIDIDSGDQTDLVYKWVKAVNEFNPNVRAVKGVRDLRYSEDEVYQEPAMLDINNDKGARKTLAETMGVTLYQMGAHRAHEQILAGILRNKNKEIKTNVWYFNKQSYKDYEKQITSCKKLIDIKSTYTKAVYKLRPGLRKEAIDCEKMAYHAFIAIGGMNYEHANWKAIEDYLYS